MPLLAKEVLPVSNKDILSWCWENRSSYPQDKPIYTSCEDPSKFVTSEGAWKTIRQITAGLRAIGIKKGDAVCIDSFNDVYYSILVLGIIGAGAAYVGVNPGYTDFEMQHALKISNTKLIIAEPALLDAVCKSAEAVGIAPSRILLFNDEHGPKHRSWRSLLQHGKEDWVSFDDQETSENTAAFFMFSSGTTGLPKAAQISHRNLIAEHVAVYEGPNHHVPWGKDRRIYPTPAFHVAAGSVLHITTLRSGNAAWLMRRFELLPWLENVGKFGITTTALMPPLVYAILQIAREKPDFVKKCLSNVKHAGCGAAPLDKDSQLALLKLLPADASFTQGWGMTECSGIGCFFWPWEKDDTGSIGHLIPNLDVKLVDEDGREVGPWGVRGEFCLRGPQIIKGYLNNPEANSQSWDDDGFFHTGDIMHGDEKTGLWYIVDRAKELIKVRAFQVSPTEIEAVLMLHRNIADAAVIGVPVKEGELPKAFVAKSANCEISKEEVKSWVASKLSKYKHLGGGVEFVDAVPRSASGKILKKQLREQEAKRRRNAKL